MPKILFDIYHLPQFNFLKNAILAFEPDEVDVFCVNRGRLRQVVEHELPNYKVTCIGDYKYNKGPYSMLFRIILPRLYRLYRTVNPKKYRYVLTAHYQANVVAKLRRIPNIAFSDDPRKYVFPILKASADEVYLPPFQDKHRGVKVFNALKEWAYLSPRYFNPDPEILKAFDLDVKQYIFVREVSTETSNYLHQQKDIILSVAKEFPASWSVVLSLENKGNRDKYPAHWLILEEPVPDIHSLMYFSQVVLSSGDSMAREGAILGVPSIYAGQRDMPANQIMIDKGALVKVNTEEIVNTIQGIIDLEIMNFDQLEFRDKLTREWDDITRLILNKVREKAIA